jgi:hypothetical protein
METVLSPLRRFPNRRAGRYPLAMTATPTVKFPSGESVPALGQGTWNMGDSVRRRKEEASALRLGIDLGMTLAPRHDRGLRKESQAAEDRPARSLSAPLAWRRSHWRDG